MHLLQGIDAVTHQICFYTMMIHSEVYKDCSLYFLPPGEAFTVGMLPSLIKSENENFILYHYFFMTDYRKILFMSCEVSENCFMVY